MMEQDLLILCIAVLGASTLQAATGIGFGVIAGPIFLVVLNDGTAIQVSVLLNLLIALLLAPSLRQKADAALLKRLLAGLVIGSPLGLLIFLHMDIGLLKAFAGLVVLFTLLLVLRGDRQSSTVHREAPKTPEKVSVGIVAGIMGSSLAMPGPVPAAWMSARGFDKETIRATILVMFVAAYSIALLLQYTLAGLTRETLVLAATLAPVTIAGIFAGQLISTRISAVVFRRLLVAILAATTMLLFATLR